MKPIYHLDFVLQFLMESLVAGPCSPEQTNVSAKESNTWFTHTIVQVISFNEHPNFTRLVEMQRSNECDQDRKHVEFIEQDLQREQSALDKLVNEYKVLEKEAQRQLDGIYVPDILEKGAR